MEKILTALCMAALLILCVGYLGGGEGEAAMPTIETEKEETQERVTTAVRAEETELLLPAKSCGKTDGEGEKTEEIQTFSPEVHYQMIVNREHPLPEGYAPEIVEVGGRNVRGEKKAARALEAMLAAGEGEGLQFVVCSGFRTEDEQRKLYLNQIQKKLAEGLRESEAVREAERYSAVPGYSEHQTGLAFDIVALRYQNLDEGYAQTPEAKWLLENAERYGFILRYPRNKQDVTGIGYEPWHFRYVGCAAAEAIMRAACTLEEWSGD